MSNMLCYCSREVICCFQDKLYGGIFVKSKKDYFKYVVSVD